MNKELRILSKKGLELRTLANDSGGTDTVIAGTAIPYGSSSEEMWGFREIIAPGAFAHALSGDIRCLWNHDTGKPLGRTSSNTLTLTDTKDGLQYECKLPNNSWGIDAREAISRGDVTGTSFGFRVREDDWVYVENQLIRTILEAELFEVSPVTFPAYPESSVEARSQELLTEGRRRAAGGSELGIEDREQTLDLFERRLRLAEAAHTNKKIGR